MGASSDEVHLPFSMRSHLLWGAFVGALAGAVAGGLDLASTILWLAPGPDRLRLVLTLPLLGAALGALLGGGAAALDALLARRVASRLRRHALLAALPMLVTARLLFGGGKMRRLPMQWLLQPLAALVLVAGCAVGLTLLRAALVRARQPGGPRRLTGVAFVLLAMVTHAVDHRLLPRQYEYLHAGLGALTLLGAAGALSLVLTPSRVRVGVQAAVAAASLVLGLGLGWRLESWPNVRAEVFGVHAPFVRHGAIAASTLRGARGAAAPAVDPAALARAQARLQGPQGAGHTLPVSPGAHLLLLTVDALRGDRVGRGVMPTVDGLARTGTHFARAYAQAPHSSYSLSSLHTAEYLHETLALGQPQPLETFAGTLNRAGWHTAALYTRGIFFTEGDRLTAYRDNNFGFARAAHVDRMAAEQTQAAQEEVDDIARRGEPLSLLWVHYFDAHAPYQGQGPNPMAQYDAAARTVDGRIDALVRYARSRLRRPVVVAVTADHGEEFHEHGGVYHGATLHDEQVRVPMVLEGPGVPARRVETPVQLIDLVPTLLGLAGVTAPPTMRGRDLRPWMSPTPPTEAPTVFSAVNNQKMALRWPWKLIDNVTYGTVQLYNLEADPAERHNLAGRDTARVTELRAELAAWLASLTASMGDQGPLGRARLGDRAAVPGLLALAADTGANEAQRVEAIDLLERFAQGDLRPSMRPLLDDGSDAVADAAAIALGNARDADAIPRLRGLCDRDPPTLRWRAARALALLGDGTCFDALVQGLHAADEFTRLSTLVAMAELGDPRGLEPLLAVLPDDHVRYRVVLALGRTRDPRAFEPLSERCAHDETDDARGYACAALGALGDRQAIPQLRDAITLDRAEPYAAAALAALDALGRTVPGFDARDGVRRPPAGFARCEAHEDTLGWHYLRAYHCASAPAQRTVPLPFHAPRGDRLLVLRGKWSSSLTAPVALRDGRGVELARWSVGPGWEEVRVALRASPGGRYRLDLAPDGGPVPAALQMAHALVLPLR